MTQRKVDVEEVVADFFTDGIIPEWLIGYSNKSFRFY